MCLPQTINPVNEFEPCDLVYPDYVVENRQVYHSQKQRWVYLSEQTPSEAWLFLQADTEDLSAHPGESWADVLLRYADVSQVAHTAFPMPGVGPADVPPRESIEARALVYFDGFEDER
jgi:hypothetical protein